MKKTKLSKFYGNNSRLTYHPRKNLLAKRIGIRRLISFDDRFVTIASRLEVLIINLPKSKVRILDIGVGDAAYESMLGKRALNKSEIYGIDISERQLSRSRNYLAESKVVDLNSEGVPYDSDFFDIVIVSELLEHVFFPEKVLNEALRVLKNNGYLVITYPNSGSLQLRMGLLLKGFSPLLNYPQNSEHIRFYNKADIISMVGGKCKEIYFQGLSSFLFGKWNFHLKIITPRFLQVFGNKFLPGLALGNLLIFKK